MASLLVYLEPERLAALLPEYAAGDTWLIPKNAISNPQLERLDEHSWLVLVSDNRFIAVVRKPRIDDGVFIGGSAILYERDLEDVLHRLGCAGIAGLARWAEIPRVLPPSDLDMLRYQLALSDDDESIGPVLPDDERTRELRDAIWEDPDSDDARLVYADHLQDRGDPRGELVALQVSRIRSGDYDSDRERQLLRHIAADCAQPLTPYLVPGFRLRRGFVSKCTVNDAPMPDSIRDHIAWRTVDDLSTTNYGLLVSPHVRARRVGLGGEQLVQLVLHPRPLPFETLVGMAPLGSSQRGLWVDQAHWDTVTSVGALAAVRVLSVNPEMSGFGPRLFFEIFRSPLGLRIHQLDAFIDLARVEPERWREAFDLALIPLLTLRFVSVLGPEVLVALRRTAGGSPQLIVQVDAVLTTSHVTEVMWLIARLSRDIQTAELHDFGGPMVRIRERQHVLLARLEAMFQHVIVQPATAKSLTP